jgi:hypothetical protein
LDEVLERFERENMFRTEYQQRDVEDIVNRRENRNRETELLLMRQEEKREVMRCDAERDVRENCEVKYDEMLRIRQALNEVFFIVDRCNFC